MVSFWPWKGHDSSPASFEKTLSALSVKIADTQARLDRARSSSRRTKVLWTLYLSFAYLVYAIVLLLVVGHRNLGAYEWTGVAGGPVFIYGTRALITSLFGFRVDGLQERLKAQEEERAKTIQKLKDATKYDSTLELIEKYGGPDGTPLSRRKGDSDSDDEAGKKKSARSTPARDTPNRTPMPPPPTANIQQRRHLLPGTPATPLSSPPAPAGSVLDPGAEFAPNAFSHAPSSSPPPHALPAAAAATEQRHWYDRIFDVLLGEDESAPKNRIALICHACRLVNGQAPPGTKSLAELGLWKCMACGAANGPADEGSKIVSEVLHRARRASADGGRPADDEPADDGRIGGGDEAAEGEGGEGEAEAEAGGPAAGVRSRRRRGKK